MAGLKTQNLCRFSRRSFPLDEEHQRKASDFIMKNGSAYHFFNQKNYSIDLIKTKFFICQSNSERLHNKEMCKNILELDSLSSKIF